MLTLSQLKSIYKLTTKQYSIIKYMLPKDTDNDITLSLDDIESILSQGKNIKYVSVQNKEELIKAKNLYLNATGAIILFEMNEVYPISEINTWLDIIHKDIDKDAPLIFACRTKEDVEHISMTMLSTH